MDFQKYIGLTYKEKGRTLPELDCYGLVRLIYKQELNIDLPSFEDSYEISEEARLQELLAQQKEGWEQTAEPIAGDIVLFRIMGYESHVGVMVSADEFIHIRKNVNSVKESIHNAMWKKRVVGFYRYVENKSCKEAPKQSGLATLNAVPHPLRTERYTKPIPAGTSLEVVIQDIDKEHKVSDSYEVSRVIMINGVPVPKENWSTTFVNDGDSVAYRCVPRAPVFAVAALFATQIATWMVSLIGLPTIVSIFGSATTFIAIAKTAITLGALALLRGSQRPPAEPKNPGTSERQLFVSGSENRANPYGAIPVVLGKVRLTPVLGAQNYATFENQRDTFLSMLLVWGYGPLDIQSSTYKFGEVPISNFTDYNIITLDRKTEPNAETKRQFDLIYGKDVDQKAPQQELVCDGNPEVVVPPGPWYESSTTQQVDSVTLAFHFPQGLRRVKLRGSDAGESYGTNVSIEVQSSPDGVTWYPLDIILAITEVTSARSVNTFDPNTGVYTWNIQYEPGVVYAKKDAFTISKTYNSSVTNAFKFVRARRLTGDNTEDNPDYRYYTTAVFQTAAFKANLAPAVDPVNCKIAKTAIKIKASDQLNGNLEGFNAIVQTIAPTWNGVTWVDAPTSNPASLFIHVLTHPANPRRKTLSQINLTELAYFYTYCSNKGFEYNSVLATQRSVMDVLKDICAAGRASPNLKDGKYTVVIDEEKAVVQHFTPHNSWGFEAVKALPQIPHGLRVNYFDQDSGYQESEIIVYNTGYSPANASLFESLSLPGVTKKSSVIDHARWQFASGKLRPETYSLNTDIEYLICNRGDRVKVTHDVPLWGLGSGRIKNKISATVLGLDESLYMEVGKTYMLRIRSDSGSSATRTLITPGTSGFYSTITLTSSISDTDAKAGDLIMFGENNQEAQDLIIIAIETAENMSARLIMMDYGVTSSYNLFTQYADQTANFVFETQITLPPTSLYQAYALKKPSISGFVSDESVMEVISKGVFRINMNVSYTNDFDLPPETVWVEAEYDLAAAVDPYNSKIARADYVSGTVSIKDVLEGEQYKVRLRYVANDGRTGLWTDYSTHFVEGKRNQPSGVTGFTVTAEPSMGKVRLSWSPNPEPDVKEYEIRSVNDFGDPDNVVNRLWIGDNTTCLLDPPATPGSSSTFYIRAVDYTGLLSRQLSQVTYTYPVIQNVTSIEHSFSDDSLTSAVIDLSWIKAVSEFDIDYYVISYDSVSKDVKSNTITLPADWIGNRAYTVRTVDILGNTSSGAVVNVTKLVPLPVLDYRSQVIDNTVMLYWTLPERTSLPIDHVLLKKGATWATASSIGEKKGEFTTVLELTSGEFTYWAATVDTDGNESSPVSLTTQVAQPPNFEFFGSFVSTFDGTKSNAFKEFDGIVMPVNTSQTWATHFTSNSWTTPQNQISAGYPLYIQPTVSSGYYEEVFDYGTILASSRVILNYNGVDVSGSPTTTSDISISTDGVSYTTYSGVTSIFATNFRYVKIRINTSITGSTALFKLNYLEVRLDIKKIYDSFILNALSTDALGTVANFGKEFIDVNSINITPQGTVPLTVTYDFVDSILTSTYSVVSNICTVTRASHGFVTGQNIQISVSTGTGVTGVYTITGTTTNTFTVTMTTVNTSGNCSLYPQSCRVYVFNATTGVRVTTPVSVSLSGY